MKAFIEGILIALVFSLVAYCGIKATLERLIIDNYVKREMHILPDRLYWTDALYMDLCGSNLMWGCSDFYRSQYSPETNKLLDEIK